MFHKVSITRGKKVVKPVKNKTKRSLHLPHRGTSPNKKTEDGLFCSVHVRAHTLRLVPDAR